MVENSRGFDIIFVRPSKFEDITKYIEYINDEKILHMNIEDLDDKTAQRVIDFISGANYAKEGELVNPGNKVFCVIPKSKSYIDII